jgi:CheY-like chemotaxis protein
MQPTSGPTLLFVDDESELLDIYQSLFENIGYKVHTASSGNSALEFLKRTEVDLIVSDVRMPDGNGIEFLKSIRASRKNDCPPFVFMTGYPDFTAEEAQAWGAAAVMRKPHNFDELTNMINSILRAS